MNVLHNAFGHMIIGMRNGRDPADIAEDMAVQIAIDNDGEIKLDKTDLINVTQYIVQDLYDGKFPINHLEVGDICYDTIGNKCIVTNVDKFIHVLYPNGKTHKFPKYQEEKFKKTNANVKKNLTDMFLYLEETVE